MAATPNKISRRRVKVLTKQGYSSQQIATELGCAKDTVTRIRKELKISDYSTQRPRYSEEELAFARRLLEDGAGYAETARTLGRNMHRLAKKLPGYGHLGPVGVTVAKMNQQLRDICIARGIDPD